MRLYTTVEIDEDDVLDELADHALIGELERRGYACAKTGLGETDANILDRLHFAAKFRDDLGMQRAVSDLLYQAKGVIV